MKLTFGQELGLRSVRVLRVPWRRLVVSCALRVPGVRKLGLCVLVLVLCDEILSE